MEEFLMTKHEVDKYNIFERYKDGKIKLDMAAIQLGLSYRQTKRLWRNYKIYGIAGIVSKKRGKISNRSISEDIKNKAVELLKKHYYDFKPTFAAEKLKECHGISLSKETVRQLMIKASLWFIDKPKINVHQRRPRRQEEGELIQSDASDHAWFEQRGPRCHLHIAVDDATSKIKEGRFELEECTKGYMHVFLNYIQRDGMPLAVYVDRRGTFKVNQGTNAEDSFTQFSRAMKELGIKIIFAYSPQAKGRVERAFGTLQDRLVKELRLNNIHTIEAANRFLPSYIEKYNAQFGEQPASSSNAHRPLNHTQNLRHILCIKDERTVSKNLEVQYNNEIYQIDPKECIKHDLRRRHINMLTTLDEELLMEYQGNLLEYKIWKEEIKQPKEVTTEDLLKLWKLKRQTSVSTTHPWKGQARGMSL